MIVGTTESAVAFIPVPFIPVPFIPVPFIPVPFIPVPFIPVPLMLVAFIPVPFVIPDVELTRASIESDIDTLSAIGTLADIGPDCTPCVSNTYNCCICDWSSNVL